ncbi:MAG: propanediol utilization protein [Firmicutes bacterium]|nr:propanediol utilization protein [Bacillota bacterium]
MEEKISIGVSNRHVHLTKEIYEMLFDEELEFERPLNQTGEFASKQTLTICVGDNEISGVKVLGPFRTYNQVEISRKDSLKLKINPPVRASGDLENAEQITLKTAKGTVTLNACIIAQRHIHMTPQLAEKYKVVDKQKVQIRIDGDRSGIIDAYIKISDNAYFEAHVDTDDACAFLLQGDIKGTLII